MNEKTKQLLDKLETLGERSDFWHKNFWITRSFSGGYTVACIKLCSVEYFSNAQRVVDFLSRYDKKLQQL